MIRELYRKGVHHQRDRPPHRPRSQDDPRRLAGAAATAAAETARRSPRSWTPSCRTWSSASRTASSTATSSSPRCAARVTRAARRWSATSCSPTASPPSRRRRCASRPSPASKPRWTGATSASSTHHGRRATPVRLRHDPGLVADACTSSSPSRPTPPGGCAAICTPSSTSAACPRRCCTTTSRPPSWAGTRRRDSLEPTLPGLRPLLRLHAPGLPTLPGPDQGQGRERRALRARQLLAGPALRRPGRPQPPGPDWLDSIANVRVHGTTGEIPAGPLAAGAAAAAGWQARLRHQPDQPTGAAPRTASSATTATTTRCRPSTPSKSLQLKVDRSRASCMVLDAQEQSHRRASLAGRLPTSASACRCTTPG